jgi:2-polyprenyl-6-hydroxyphenyl methylase/3-demethylubiquinone-9 3-methyltransferase
MWAAIDAACASVAQNGLLSISIYNDQGAVSAFWTCIKRIYNRSPRWFQFLLVLGYLIPAMLWFAIRGLVRLRNPREWFPLVNERGMHYYYDVVDWMGGYPFEVSTPEAIVDYVTRQGFTTLKVNRRSGSGCNEFVFRRTKKSK